MISSKLLLNNFVLPVLRFIDESVFHHKWGWFCGHVFDWAIAADFDKYGENHPLMALFDEEERDMMEYLAWSVDHGNLTAERAQQALGLWNVLSFAMDFNLRVPNVGVTPNNIILMSWYSEDRVHHLEIEMPDDQPDIVEFFYVNRSNDSSWELDVPFTDEGIEIPEQVKSCLQMYAESV